MSLAGFRVLADRDMKKWIDLPFEGVNVLPVVFHAYHEPAVLTCFGHQSFGKSSDVSAWETRGRSKRVLARRVVMKNEHHQPRAIPCLGPFQHRGVAFGISERRVWPLTDEHVDGLPCGAVVDLLEVKLDRHMAGRSGELWPWRASLLLALETRQRDSKWQAKTPCDMSHLIFHPLQVQVPETRALRISRSAPSSGPGLVEC